MNSNRRRTEQLCDIITPDEAVITAPASFQAYVRQYQIPNVEIADQCDYAFAAFALMLRHALIAGIEDVWVTSATHPQPEERLPGGTVAILPTFSGLLGDTYDYSYVWLPQKGATEVKICVSNSLNGIRLELTPWWKLFPCFRTVAVCGPYQMVVFGERVYTQVNGSRSSKLVYRDYLGGYRTIVDDRIHLHLVKFLTPRVRNSITVSNMLQQADTYVDQHFPRAVKIFPEEVMLHKMHSVCSAWIASCADSAILWQAFRTVAGEVNEVNGYLRDPESAIKLPWWYLSAWIDMRCILEYVGLPFIGLSFMVPLLLMGFHLFCYVPLVVVLTIGIKRSSLSASLRYVRDQYYYRRTSAGPLAFASVVNRILRAPKELIHVPRSESPPQKIVSDNKMEIVGSMERVEAVDKRPVVNVISNPVTTLAPSHSSAVVVDAVRKRVLSEPPLDPDVQQSHWNEVFPLIPELVQNHDSIDPELVYEEWYNHLPSNKRSKYWYARKRVLSRDFKNTQLMAKCDETLVKLGEDWAARIIQNVDPLYQVMCGPSIYAATKRLKALWPADNMNFVSLDDKHSIAVTFGSGLCDLDLDHWFACNDAVDDPNKYRLIIAGDDSLLYNNGHYYSSDYSKYDQSQSFGPLDAEYQCLERLGVQKEVLDLLKRMALAPYEFKDRRRKIFFQIKHEHRPMRCTGGPDTTFGNSVNNVFAWCFALTHGHDIETWKTGFDYLGFKVKLHESTEFPDFLKGTWYPCVQDHIGRGSVAKRCWGPLPSRVIKLGKALTDPKRLYATKDETSAFTWFMEDVCHSMASYEYVPILGAMLRRWNSHPTIQRKHLDMTDVYKPAMAGHTGVRSTADTYTYVANHYGCDLATMKELEQLYATLEVQTHISHPLYLRLAADDYDPDVCDLEGYGIEKAYDDSRSYERTSAPSKYGAERRY
jgi:hypothetical protein